MKEESWSALASIHFNAVPFNAVGFISGQCVCVVGKAMSPTLNWVLGVI